MGEKQTGRQTERVGGWVRLSENELAGQTDRVTEQESETDRQTNKQDDGLEKQMDRQTESGQVGERDM